MGEEKLQHLQVLQQEVQSIGQEFWAWREEADKKELEFFQRLEDISSQIQRESGAEDEYHYLQYRVDRHRDFGEPLP
ncbi:MAG: hypothetical protein F6K30_04185 [Cyanothece sp. SIO2G6]|nr:hypothetical protein [Cyanothece sp. SIO2G6]